MKARNQGDPCTPEKLMEMDYEGDEFLVRETTVSIFGCKVLEVELVSFQDNKTWFVFEVELDGNTKISHILSKSLVSKSWEMSKVAAAANKILKLPAVPSRAYSMISLVLMMLFSAAWDQDRDRSM